MGKFVIMPRGHLLPPGFMRVPDDYEAQEGEIVVNDLTPTMVWDEEGQRVRELFEEEKFVQAKSEHKQHLYNEGMVVAVRPLMRGDTPDEWQDELFGRMLAVQMGATPDPTLQQIAAAYQRYNELATQVDAFTRRADESYANATNRMHTSIVW